MGAVFYHPALAPTSAPIKRLREVCDFRRIGYHYPAGRPELVKLFRPPHAGFYDQWLRVADFDRAVKAGSNVVGFRPAHPLLRVRYNAGDWEIIALLPNGERLVVLDHIPTRQWISAALITVRLRIYQKTGVWCATAAADWAIR